MTWTNFFRPSPAMLESMNPGGPRMLPPRSFYDMADTFYRSVDVYDNLRALGIAVGIPDEALIGLRNPVNRVVEFYAKKLFPGTMPNAMPIDAPNDAILPAIDQIQTWSNFTAVKQVLAREAALYGTCFMRVATVNDAPRPDAFGVTPAIGTAKRIYMQRIDPKVVIAHQTDERQFITVIRIDVDGVRAPDGRFIAQSDIDETLDFNAAASPHVTKTEVWDKTQMRAWVHTKGVGAGLWTLGDPETVFPLSTWGIDFVPFVHAPFRDIGERLGVACYQHALDKIVEIDRSATRLHQQLYRNNTSTWAIENTMLDPAGRPFPALDLDFMQGDTIPGEPGYQSRNQSVPSINVADETFWTLPSGYTLKTLVPPIDYIASLQVLVDAIKELEDDLPEMAYYRTRDFGTQLSGVALRLILGPAVDTAYEARGNIEAAIIRAQQMALTIGKNLGIFPELASMSYEDGDFDHTFVDRPVVPLTETEEVAVAIQKQQAGVPRDVTLVEMGYDRETVAEWKAAEEASAQQQILQAQAERATLAVQMDRAAASGDAASIRQRIADGVAANANGATPNATTGAAA